MPVETMGERLTRLLEKSGLQQKAVAHRAGLNPEAINRILRGGTADPQWSTMVKLLRDGFGVSLDEFEGGRPEPPITPYDREQSYRDLIDLLEAMPPRERHKAIETVSWLLQPRAEAAAIEQREERESRIDDAGPPRRRTFAPPTRHRDPGYVPPSVEKKERERQQTEQQDRGPRDKDKVRS